MDRTTIDYKNVKMVNNINYSPDSMNRSMKKTSFMFNPDLESMKVERWQNLKDVPLTTFNKRNSHQESDI